MGKVQHFEIPADDVGRAREFYSRVFGWTYEEWDADTLMILPGGAEGETGVIGGDMYKRDKPEPPTVVVTVDSIEDSLDAIVKAGGTPLGEIQPLGDTGRYAYFTDPEGNRIGLWDDKKP
jgi:predicted enzyme related to lactoylglutathione lyase